MEIATVTGAPTPKVDLNYLQLWDCYGALLTDNQREICEMYYMLDLSLSEIAEQKGVSRQSVSETLKKSRELLDYYEQKLHQNEQNRKYSLALSCMTAEVKKRLEAFKELHPQYAEEIGEIVRLLAVGGEMDGKEE